MAFCPECGKAVAPESASCATCGFELPKTEPKAAGARFKGTVMMTAPIVGTGTQPANVNANKPAPAAEQKIAVNAAANAVAQPKAASAGGRGSAKATMIGAGVPAEMLKAAQAQTAGAAKIGAKASNPPLVARAPAAPAEPKLTAAGAQPQAKLGGATHRKVPEAADTKRSAPPPKATAAAQTKELGSPQAKLKTPAAGQTQALASPPAKPAAPQTGPKLGVPQTNPKVAAPPTSPKLTPAPTSAAEVSATANTDEPPPPKSPSVRAVMNVPISQPPEAQFAATQAALPAPPPRPTSMKQQEPSIVVEAQAEVVPTPAVVVQVEQAQPRYLPGDPMAPQAASPMRAPRTTLPTDDAITVPREERAWLYWAVCGTVVLVVVLLAFGLFR